MRTIGTPDQSEHPEQCQVQSPRRNDDCSSCSVIPRQAGELQSKLASLRRLPARPAAAAQAKQRPADPVHILAAAAAGASEAGWSLLAGLPLGHLKILEGPMSSLALHIDIFCMREEAPTDV